MHTVKFSFPPPPSTSISLSWLRKPSVKSKKRRKEIVKKGFLKEKSIWAMGNQKRRRNKHLFSQKEKRDSTTSKWEEMSSKRRRRRKFVEARERRDYPITGERERFQIQSWGVGDLSLCDSTVGPFMVEWDFILPTVQQYDWSYMEKGLFRLWLTQFNNIF